jgi:integrase
MYRRAARLDRALPPALPTSAVEYNREERSQDALAFADFPKWRQAWEAVESESRKAFHKLNLLCGARPGELARLQWADVLPRERCFVIRGAKANNDIRIPFSVPILRELRRARDAAKADGSKNEHVFPAREGGHLVKRDIDDLPAVGMMLRRTWRTVAAELGIDELLAHFLMGHVPAGISRGYVAKLILTSGSAMRKAQRDVSAKIEALLAADSERH